MLNAQSPQTVPAVPIAMKKAQENVAGSMGSNPGAPGPQVPSSKDSKLKKPKKKLPLKYILGGIAFVVLLIGAIAGFYLTQQSQDVRNQAKEMEGAGTVAKKYNPGTTTSTKTVSKAPAPIAPQPVSVAPVPKEAVHVSAPRKEESAPAPKPVAPAPAQVTSKPATSTGGGGTVDPTSTSQQLCSKKLGSKYKDSISNCSQNSGTWSDSACSCKGETISTSKTSCSQKIGYKDSLALCSQKGGIWSNDSCSCKYGSNTTTSTSTIASTTDKFAESTIIPTTATATTTGTGDSGECALGSEQAIRDCLASKQSVYNSGACNGLNESQCLAWCQGNSDCNVQTCTGDQTKSGDKKGEFLTCNGSGGTGGCGQVDMLGPNNELLGFVMDTTGCTATSGTHVASSQETTTQSTTTTPEVTLALCSETCSIDTDCAQSDHSCEGGICRLTTNPESTTCSSVGCGDPCQVSSDCTEANHACLESTDDGNPDGGICRLIDNPTSSTCSAPAPEPSPTPTVGCNEACATSADCSATDHSCNLDTATCRLTVNPGDINCSLATPTATPAPGCNQECFSSSDCSNSSAVCYDNLCRLSTNPADTACQAKEITQTTGTFYAQPDLPQALPESGSADILNWLKVGLGALGLGLIFLFL